MESSSDIYLQFREALAEDLKARNSSINLAVLTSQTELAVAKYYAQCRQGQFEFSNLGVKHPDQKEKHERAYGVIIPLREANIGLDNFQKINDLMFDATGFEYIPSTDSRYLELKLTIGYGCIGPLKFAEYIKNSQEHRFEKVIAALQEKRELERQGIDFDDLSKQTILNLTS